MPNPTPKTVDEWLALIHPDTHRRQAAAVLDWVGQTYPQLDVEIKWKQPMFTHNGTFIIGFSFSKDNLLVAPEGELIERFGQQIVAAGYTHGKKMFRIPFAPDGQDIALDEQLLSALIDTNMKEKAGSSRFWR